MRKLLITAAAFATLLGTPALAADMPLKAPPPPPPIVSWTGFYVGGNVGYSWGDPRTDAAGSGTAPTFNFGPPLSFPFPFAFTDSNAARLKGAIGGGQIGYNYQVAPRWLLGLEADFQGSGERGSNSLVDQISAPLCFSASSPPPTCVATTPSTTGAVTGYEAKIGWFGTVRGRAGFLLTDQILVYGTGGFRVDYKPYRVRSVPRCTRWRGVRRSEDERRVYGGRWRGGQSLSVATGELELEARIPLPRSGIAQFRRPLRGRSCWTCVNHGTDRYRCHAHAFYRQHRACGPELCVRQLIRQRRQL
jgi:opacity protein-like surface antigen